ncbi:unnamed protein product [Schistosoma margrebowiei]|uniref:Uncharacterized protein n=1 Tax=Schistosoma margrebowiei TaxID=48269 RepID=A0A183N7D2_9TREM|nr:unnamed protein product [Schistosoma margrebowiei]
MLTSDVSEPYETLKRSVPRRGDLTDRQRLDQLLNIDLQRDSATDMLQRIREIIGQRTFDDDLFKQFFFSKFPQQVQAVLVSFQNNALDELAASADRTLEITKSNAEVFLAKKASNDQNDITELRHTLTHHGRLITPAGADIITSMESPPEIAENPTVLLTLNRPTRKTIRKTSKSACVNGIRDAVKADTGYTVAQLVYGTTPRLPGEFVDPSSFLMNMDLTSYTSRLTDAMRSVKPVSTRAQSTNIFVQPDLRYSAHVFVRRDSHRQPLESAYEGPFKTVHREPDSQQQVQSLTRFTQTGRNYYGGQLERDQRSTNFHVSGSSGPQETSSDGMDLYQNPRQDSRKGEQEDSN